MMRSVRLKSAVCCGMGVLALGTVQAAMDIYRFKSAATDMLDAASYEVSHDDGKTYVAAAELPQPNTMLLFDGALSTAYRSIDVPEGANALLSRLHTVGIQYVNLTITCTTNTTFFTAVSGANATNKVGRAGRFIKKGAGDLHLNGYGHCVASGKSCDYLFKELVVEEGVVRVFDQVNMTTSGGYLGIIAVSNGASFYVPRGADLKNKSITLDGLVGEGGIVYEDDSTDYSVSLGLNVKDEFVFGGLISGALVLNVYGQQALVNKNNAFPRSPNVYAGGSLGHSGGGAKRADPSSLGSSPTFAFVNETSQSAKNPDLEKRLVYKGKGGDTLDKQIYFYPGSTSVIDGGNTGGLSVIGPGGDGYLWYNTDSTHSPGVGRLVFQGDGPKTNFIYGGFYCKATNVGESPISILKRGRGTWSFPTVSATSTTVQYNGTFAVDGGTLQYGSLAPVGQNCSLGLGTLTYDPDYVYCGGDYDTSKTVGWHIRLGDGSSTDATLEYVGTERVENTDRIIALNGSGTVKNAAGSSIVFKKYGFMTVKDGTNALTLDGVTEAGDITNHVGTLSVTKTGANIMELKKDLAFNGALAVKEGRLKVANPTRYSYYRFVVKDNMAQLCDKPGFKADVRFCELALFDAAGNNLALDLAYVRGCSIAGLGINEATIETGGEATGSSLSTLFNGVAEQSNAGWQGRAPNNLDPTNKDTWLRIVMRIPETANAVTAYDFVSCYNGPDAKAGDPMAADAWYVAEPRVYALQGSGDGATWVTLHSEADAWSNHITKNGYWASSDKGEQFAKDVCPDSRWIVSADYQQPTYPMALRNVTEVSVAAGASLEYLGNVSPISRLVMDAAGVGSFVRVVLAEAGVLDIVNYDDSKCVTIPVDWSGFVNPEVLRDSGKWRFTLNGSENPRRVVVITPTGIEIRPKGLILVVR